MKYYKELFQAIIELFYDPAWVKDPDGTYVHVNQAFVEFLDMEVDEILGKKAHEIFPSVIAEVVLETDCRAIDSRGRISFEEEFPGADGDAIPFRSSKAVVITKTGEVVYTVGMGCNVDKLHEAEQELAVLIGKLEDSDVALRVVLDLRERDKKNTGNRTAEALAESVLPYLYKLQQGHLDSVQSLLLDTVIGNVQALMRSHSQGMENIFLNLTPTEMQIAKLVRRGLIGKEIAEQLSMSPATVNTHRRNIRKRLGLNKTKTNLRQFLLQQ